MQVELTIRRWNAAIHHTWGISLVSGEESHPADGTTIDIKEGQILESTNDAGTDVLQKMVNVNFAKAVQS
jgi:hypothetical protein